MAPLLVSESLTSSFSRTPVISVPVSSEFHTLGVTAVWFYFHSREVLWFPHLIVFSLFPSDVNCEHRTVVQHFSASFECVMPCFGIFGHWSTLFFPSHLDEVTKLYSHQHLRWTWSFQLISKHLIKRERLLTLPVWLQVIRLSLKTLPNLAYSVTHSLPFKVAQKKKKINCWKELLWTDEYFSVAVFSSACHQ